MEFQITTILPKLFTATFLSLISKMDNLQGLKDYRPICLIGSLYKILSKVLAVKLKRVIVKVICPFQSNFITGRQILDGVLVIKHIIDLVKKRKDECLLFKVDFKKAYNFVSWDFLIYMLRHMGFDQRWITWMQVCICSSTMPVLVKGSPTEEFQMHKGLKTRQSVIDFSVSYCY